MMHRRTTDEGSHNTRCCTVKVCAVVFVFVYVQRVEVLLTMVVGNVDRCIV